MKIRTGIYLIFSVLYISSSCSDDSTESVVITKVSDFIVHSLDNSGPEPTISENNRFLKEAYMLSIEMRLDLRPTNDFYSYTNIALSDPITSIRIITLDDFSSSYLAGSDITVFFSEYPVELLYTLHDSTIENIPISKMNYYNGYFYKALLTAPPAGIYTFQVEITFESGQVLTKQTQPTELY